LRGSFSAFDIEGHGVMEIWLALIGTVPSLATLAGVVYSIHVSQGNRRVVDRVETKVGTVDNRVANVESHTNGLLAAAKQETVVAKTVAEATAAGIVAGAQQERARAINEIVPPSSS
jgi:hypothetical protein